MIKENAKIFLTQCGSQILFFKDETDEDDNYVITAVKWYKDFTCKIKIKYKKEKDFNKNFDKINNELVEQTSDVCDKIAKSFTNKK